MSHRPVAFITGGGTGIGAACATALRRTGWDVIICGRRPDPLAAVASACGAISIIGDAGSEADVDRMVTEVENRFGRLDGLVLNAGVVRAAKVTELSVDDWDDTLRTNLTGPFLVARRALPLLVASRGAIVSVSSVAALRAGPGYAAYGASKAGLVMLTQVLAIDHGGDGVRANVVCPGWTRTEMADAEMAELAEADGTTIDAAYRKATAPVPLRRPATSAEVANAVCWLLSPESAYVNGAVLTVDGGLSALDAGVMPFLDL